VLLGLLGGVCCVVMSDDREPDGWLKNGLISRVMLGETIDTCLAAAKVFEAWEGGRSVWLSRKCQ
jgi:hypothetical protein